MAEKKFSELTAKGATIADTDLVAISESAGGGTYTSKSVTGANIKALVTDANLSTTDVTTNNVSTTKHGFAPKAPNDTTKFLRGDGTWAAPVSGSTSGKFGVADSTGAYTYYTTLQAAITAATAGQVVEMFTDYTESTVTAITLKDGVNINGNGHTYSYTAATGNCFIDNGVAVISRVQNLNVIRTNHTSGNIFTITSGTSIIDFTGTYLQCTSASSSDGVILCGGTISSINVKAIGANLKGIVVYGYGAKGIVRDSYAETTGAGTAIYGENILYGADRGVFNCIGKSVSGYGIYDAQIFNSHGWSTSGTGIQGDKLNLCTGVSISSYGLVGTYVNNCIGISTSGVAIRGGLMQNSSANSSTGNAILPNSAGDKYYNSSFYSAGAAVSSWYHVGNYYNCNLESAWNNSSGHCIVDWDTMVSSTEITNCVLKVANSSANCIYATNASTPKYANNVYSGATTPVNANVTQGITNTQDNQGNIKL